MVIKKRLLSYAAYFSVGRYFPPHSPPPKENKTAGPKLLQFKFKTMNRRNDINHNFGTDKTFPFLICHPFLERATFSYLSNLFILVIYNH